jgi:DNA gyrase subunit B/topoisomerase-4 subunit B
MKVTPGDVREGLVAIVSVYIKNPQFQGQTKDRLNNTETEKEVLESVRAFLSEEFFKETSEIKKIARRVESSVRARVASRDAADAIKRSTPVNRVTLPGKLSDCSSTSLEETELFIVEGDSAGGSAKQGRNRKTQAILPLRGKVLNVESASIKKALENAEISDLITAIGTGVLEGFNLDKLRYGKIIIMTDADSDGHHIATLLLTFFYRYMPRLIKEGRIFLAQPPLYKIAQGTNTLWAISDAHKDMLTRKLKGNIEITRFKGLGEMPAKVLYDTTMNPETRELLAVRIDSEDDCDFWIGSLMGRDAEIRQELISMYSSDYVDITI